MEKDYSLDGKGILIFSAVHGKDDLNPITFIKNIRVIVNPPPKDGRCMCCGRHISQLKPFKENGHPYDGALLLKNFRSQGPYNEEAVKAMKKAIKRSPEDPLPWLIKMHGNERGNQIYSASEDHLWIVKSWECNDCIKLSEGKYFLIRGSKTCEEVDMVHYFQYFDDKTIGHYGSTPFPCDKLPLLVDTKIKK